MGGFGTTEVLIIIGIIVLFFGAKKIPELARGIGQGINEFKKVSDDEDDNSKNEHDNHDDQPRVEVNEKK